MAVSVDPEIIVFNGRMLPLIEMLHDRLRHVLSQTLTTVPELTLSRADGFSGARHRTRRRA